MPKILNLWKERKRCWGHVTFVQHYTAVEPQFQVSTYNKQKHYPRYKVKHVSLFMGHIYFPQSLKWLQNPNNRFVLCLRAKQKAMSIQKVPFYHCLQNLMCCKRGGRKEEVSRHRNFRVLNKWSESDMQRQHMCRKAIRVLFVSIYQVELEDYW